MANTVVTRKALVSALKDLMEIKSFEKITITEICDRCNMNRKSFYYHFHDKYELMNWVFQSEFIASGGMSKAFGEVVFHNLCHYLYENRFFYSQAFSVEGEKNFSEYFYNIIKKIVNLSLKIHLEVETIDEYSLYFFSDGFSSAIKRWITSANPIEPDGFVNNMFSFIFNFANKICKKQP